MMDLETLHEKHTVEFKKATNQLPKSFWDSYSAFSNTEGGVIFLGIEESKPFNIIYGVDKPQEIVANLWNLLSNPQKVSCRTVNNEDVEIITYKGKEIIVVRVNEASVIQKPVYIKDNVTYTYLRTGDGDRRATEDEISAMYRNARPNSDARPIKGYTIDDLDLLSIASFKEKIAIRYPGKGFENQSTMEFLRKVGGLVTNRKTNEQEIKAGTLLFFGKYQSIREIFPNYHLDFFNCKGTDARWLDRVATDEPNAQEMNLYNFYLTVFDKLKNTIFDTFKLNIQQIRMDYNEFEESIREAFINTIAHSDYEQGFPSVRIDVYDGWYKFSNPGRMLISVEDFARGGDSRPRNETIMSFFRILGLSERQGFGGEQIFRIAAKYDYRMPEIETNLERTVLKLWNVDRLEAYPELSDLERTVFAYIAKRPNPVSNKEIQRDCEISEYYAKKTIESLIKQDKIEKIGNNKSTKYLLKMGSKEMKAKLRMLIDRL